MQVQGHFSGNPQILLGSIEFAPMQKCDAEVIQSFGRVILKL